MKASRILTQGVYGILTRCLTNWSNDAMRKKVRLRLSDRAKNDFDRLQRRIAALGAPKTAKSFVSRLRKHANRLRDFPESGSIVEDFDDPTLLEINYRSQRIFYRYD